MDKLSTEVLQLLVGLLPGFVAAEIFHAFTPHEAKKEQWARILQALIFTGIIKAIVIVQRGLFLWIGKWLALGTWTDGSATVLSYLSALVFGCVAAIVINRDLLHGFARLLKFTKETAAPSEWCYAFDRHEWYVVLHLKGGQRLYGWPEQWPNKSDCGHFSITQPAWCRPDGSEKWQLPQLRRILVPAADVGMVEMYKDSNELNQIGLTGDQIKEMQKPLAELHRKANDDGGQPEQPLNGERRDRLATAGVERDSTPSPD